MFCKKCGSQLPENTVICPSCGTVAEAETQQPYAYAPQKPLDNGSVGWWFLGFFFPLIGLVLFLVWRNDKPLSAKRAGWGALVGVIVSVVFSILFSFVFAALFAGIFGGMMNDPSLWEELCICLF